MADGSRHSMFAVQESVYGETPNSPALDTVRITGTTLGLAKDSLQSEEIRSDRMIADFRLAGNNVAGDINFELSFTTFDDFLRSVLCSADWAGDIIKGGVERTSYSFVRSFADIASLDKPYYIYRGCEFNAMSLSIAANAMVTGTFSVVGQSQEIATDLTGLGTPTFPAPTETSPVDAFTGSIKEAGAAIAVVTEVSIDLQNGIEPRFVVGSKDTIRPSIARSNLTGNLTAYFENSTLVEKFVNETGSSLEMDLTDLEGNVIRVTIPSIVYTGGQPDVTGEGPVTLSMPWQAILDDTAETNIVIQRIPI